MLPNYALIDAIRRDNEHDAREAFDAGAELTARDFNGESVLEVAERYGALNSARMLLTKGADPNQLVGTHVQRILHRAASKGNFGLMQLLIDSRADVNAEDKNGKRPLHLAAARGFQYICMDLIQAGAKVNAQTQSGKTALHYAAGSGDCATIKTLLSSGASASILDGKGFSPAMEAARKGQIAAVKLFIEYSNPGVLSQSIEAEKLMKFAEKAGQTAVALAIHETYGVSLSSKQQMFNWLE